MLAKKHKPRHRWVTRKRVWPPEECFLTLRCHCITMVQATESQKGLNLPFTRGANFCRPTCPVMSTNQACGLCVYTRAAEGFRSPYTFMRARSKEGLPVTCAKNYSYLKATIESTRIVLTRGDVASRERNECEQDCDTRECRGVRRFHLEKQTGVRPWRARRLPESGRPSSRSASSLLQRAQETHPEPGWRRMAVLPVPFPLAFTL
jgi:hypothetical protein